MAPSRSSLLAFSITVVLGGALVVGARVALPSGAEPVAAAAKTSATAERSDSEEGAAATGHGEAHVAAVGSAPPGRSLDEMMAEHERLRTALRDAEASGDGAALTAAVAAAQGRFRDPASIVEHAGYSAIALCRTGEWEEGQRAASLWIQSESKHALRPKVESACAGPVGEAKPAPPATAGR